MPAVTVPQGQKQTSFGFMLLQDGGVLEEADAHGGDSDDDDDTPCNDRGSGRFLELSDRYQAPAANSRAFSCISRIVAVCQDFSHTNRWATSLFNYFSDVAKVSEDVSGGNTLLDLVKKCEISHKQDVVMNVVSMLVDIQLRAKVESVKSSERLQSNIEVYRRFLHDHHKKGRIQLTEYAFKKRCGHGALFAALAKAGTLYFLFLIAAAKCKSTVQNEIQQKDIEATCTSLLRPNPKERLGRLVINTIIPAIAIYRRHYAFQVHTMFSRELLSALGLKEVVDSSDIAQTDRFLDGLRTNTFKINRDWEA
ncbi:hypothetical protein MPER_06521, partial [Moniliophthora perniciosa FA553]